MNCQYSRHLVTADADGGPSLGLYLDTIPTYSVIGNTITSGQAGAGGNSCDGDAGDVGYSFALFTNNLAPGTGPAMDADNNLTGGSGGTGGSASGTGGAGTSGSAGPFIDF